MKCATGPSTAVAPSTPRGRSSRLSAQPRALCDTPFTGRITLVGAVEEEAVTSKGARHVLDLYDPDVVIIGEPSGWDAITLGYKGRLVIHYRLERPMAHTATRELVPAEEAVAFWQKATGLLPEPGTTPTARRRPVGRH